MPPARLKLPRAAALLLPRPAWCRERFTDAPIEGVHETPVAFFTTVFDARLPLERRLNVRT